MRRHLRLADRPGPPLTVTITADASGFIRAMGRLADELEKFGRRAREVAGGMLLLDRRLVDPTATAEGAAEWMSPVCRGWLCGSCPGLDCHHRCHPGGHLR